MKVNFVIRKENKRVCGGGRAYLPFCCDTAEI